MKLIFERNSIINISLIFGSVLLGIYVSPLFFLLWLLVQLIDDILYYSLAFSIFDPEIRIKRGYQFGNVFLQNTSGHGRDLGFNLYEGNLTKNRRQAQIDKWDFMLKELKLKAGDSLIDIGCGYGDWLNYAKSKGIHAVGVNITPEQAAEARALYGLDVICTNWKDIPKSQELREKLYGKFDAVTFMDTIEHYVPAKWRKNGAAQERIYKDMFELASNLLKPNSDSKRVFISCLHRKSDHFESIRESFSLYLLDKYHSGCYPLGDDGLSKNASSYFQELKRLDRTEDYRLTSVMDRDHFGAPLIQMNWKKWLHIPLLLLLDPNHLHKWLDIKTDAWMWWHFGDRAWEKNYGQEHQKQLSRVTLWWIVFERAPSK